MHRFMSYGAVLVRDLIVWSRVCSAP